MSTISVVVPVYNSEEYLVRCFESIVHSTEHVDEIIVVNDGSTDQSQCIIDNFDFNGIRTKCFYQENAGLSSARNLGISKVSSDYFVLLDSDDYIDKSLVENFYCAAKNKDLDLISFQMQRVSFSLEPMELLKKHSLKNCSGIELLVHYLVNNENFVAACGYIYRTEFYRSNNFMFSVGRYHEDYGLIPLVLLNARNVLAMDRIGYYYVYTPNSIMRVGDSEKEIKKATDVIEQSLDLLSNLLELSLTSYDFSIIVNFIIHTMFSKIKSLERVHQKKLRKKVRFNSKRMLLNRSSIKLRIRLVVCFISTTLYQVLFYR